MQNNESSIFSIPHLLLLVVVISSLVALLDPIKNIKWIKERWRKMMKIQDKGLKVDSETIQSDVDPNHTSEFLDLIVLSADVDLKMKAICLTKKFPFVLESTSGCRRAWEYLHLLCIIILSTVNPYLASFERKIPLGALSYLLFAEIVCFFDIGVQMSTAILSTGGNIINPLQICIQCCKKVSFLADIFASFPIYLCVMMTGSSDHTVALVRLNICIKVTVHNSTFNTLEIPPFLSIL